MVEAMPKVTEKVKFSTGAAFVGGGVGSQVAILVLFGIKQSMGVELDEEVAGAVRFLVDFLVTGAVAAMSAFLGGYLKSN